MKIRCMSGMLMCLDRGQRLIYVLGDVFNIDHHLGAEIFGLSKQNFRVKLHRARKGLYSYMNSKCGLVNKDNPCRCPKKTKALIPTGLVDAENMQFNISKKHTIENYVEVEHENLMDVIEDKHATLFREHPTREDFSSKTIVDEVLNDDKLMSYLRNQ